MARAIRPWILVGVAICFALSAQGTVADDLPATIAAAAAQPDATPTADQQQPPPPPQDASSAAAAAAADPAAVGRAKAEVAALLAQPSAAAFEAYAREQLAAAGLTPEQAAAASASSASAALAARSAAAAAAGALPPPPPHLQVLAAALAAPASGPERAARVRAFRAGLRRIDALNARSGPDLAYGLTPFVHLTPDEFRRLYLSQPFSQLRRANMASSSAAAEAPPAGDAGGDDNGSGSGNGNGGGRRRRRRLQQSSVYGTLTCNKFVSFPYGSVTPPSSLDWRNVGGVSYVAPAVRNQGTCGSCAAFAAAALIEHTVMRVNRTQGYTSANTDVSEQEALDCLAGDGCKGAMPYQYMDRAVCKGWATEASSPYKTRDQGTCSTTLKRYGAGARGWTEPPATERGVAQAATKGVVAVALYANNDFQYYKSGVMNCTAAGSTTAVNHATVLVGWNDRVAVNGSTWRVWTLRNSWGGGWGEGGYFRLRKDCAGTGSLNMYSRYYNSMLVI